ncbi:hypothetical protein [Kribbella shirazensis]|uniref:Asparagine synthetase domain-containing protein n=1 Tax=Kribbella shirazensis TaxID=1105143 RepID=A0A7X5V8S0_9ACTN|nr:hypothetical protein [Kribbella shirazensis]NIK56725.1 hypothetical protein [Kribbella shirazensis]
METLIAYTFAHDGAARAAAGQARVEAYYGDLWQHEAKHHGYDGQTVGLHMWDRHDGTCLWPSWHDTGDVRVASVHAPLGYQRVIGDVAPYDAPARLGQAVRRTPASFLEVAPPFTMAVLDPEEERLDLFTDSIGVGRLFQLRLPDGWIWSNRPVAALLFAGVPAVAASRGWTFAAACGWFMDDSTPYDGVLTVPGATHIVADGHRQQRTVSRIETASVWSTDSPDTADETAAALQDVARSVGSLFPGRPTVDLSGGRDSRVVAGAFLAAGVDLKLNSYDAVPGELDVAESLVARLQQPVDHVVTRKAKAVVAKPQVKPQPLEMVTRALRWHRYAEGLRPASYLFHTPPATLAGVAHLAIGGAGGEVAHGHYYPRDVLQLDALPLPHKLHAFGNHLQTRLIPAAGPSVAARTAVAAQIEHVLRTAVHGGIENATMLDYFYVVERLRRWGTTGERTGVVSPLLVPSFVRSAFALDPAQRVDNALHRELVRRLVPAWTDVPFFQPSPTVSTRRSPAKVRCLADAADRDLIEKLLADVEGFEPLSTLWAASTAGASSAAGEATLCQALWRATFDQHLADVNRHIPTAPAPKPRPPAPTPPAPRRSPLVRAIGRSRFWRAYRRSRFGRK